jgi:hypothetical protein
MEMWLLPIRVRQGKFSTVAVGTNPFVPTGVEHFSGVNLDEYDLWRDLRLVVISLVAKCLGWLLFTGQAGAGRDDSFQPGADSKS